MFANELITILGKVEKLQKNHSAEEYECTNGVWFLYDTERQCVVMMAMTGHTLYWEKTFDVRPDYEKELYEKLQADLAKPDNERCFPCKILKNDLAWINTLLKQYKSNLIWLADFACDAGKVKLSFQTNNGKPDPIEFPARAEADNQNSVEGMLYKEMVRHEGRWAEKYAPMEVGGWCCNTYPSGMKLCMELMATKDKRRDEGAISLVMYGSYGEDKEGDGFAHKYIEQNHWEILDANTDTPERGMIHMVVRQPEGYRKHYI